jgi:hypothetical protein
MAFHYSPNIVTNGLKMCIDPANNRSYSGTGLGVYDLSPALGITYSIVDQASWDTSNNGSFIFPTPVGTATASRIESITTQNLNTAEMTIDVWFKRTVSNNSYNMVWNTYLPYLSFNSSNYFLFSWTAVGLTQKTLLSTRTYSNDVWYNVCCTLTQDATSGTSVSNMYVNGILENTSPTYTGVTQVTNQVVKFVLGNWTASGPYPFVGNISCFKLYDRILTNSEILNNFNALKSRFGL